MISDGESSAEEAPPFEAERPQATHPLAVGLQTLVDELLGLREVMPLLSKTARSAEDEARDLKQEDLRKNPPPPNDEGDYTELPDQHRLYAGKDPELAQHEVIATGLHHARRDLGSATLLMMCAHFNGFIGDVIRTAFEISPKAMETIRSKISLSQVNLLDDVDAIRGFMIEQEIQGILDRPWAEQVGWFEAQCGMPPLEEGLGEELEEVAALYDLISCRGGRLCEADPRDESELLAPHVKGDSAFVTPQYVGRVHDTLVLVAVAICQGVWRSEEDGDEEAADANLHDLTYRLLILEEYLLAQRALQLVEAYRGTMSEFFRLVNVINLAQTYRWLGDEATCDEVLAREDWDSHSSPFRLSAAILRGSWSEAERLMQVAVQEDLLNHSAFFESWPVFREFRERPEYHRVLAQAFPD